MESSYITSAKEAEQLPDLGGAPEFAFIGRSNCGKSSLLNALLGRVNLARASRTPGRTQMVNFFSVKKGENELILADLPGYGYSATGSTTRSSWETLMNAYLKRPTIQVFLFLLDVRRAEKPSQEDLDIVAQLAKSRPVILVLTKADKVSQSEAHKITQQLTAKLQTQRVKLRRLVLASSLKGKGLDILREEMQSYLKPEG